MRRSDGTRRLGHRGDDVVEFQGSGTWTGAYRMALVGLDLVLAGEP